MSHFDIFQATRSGDKQLVKKLIISGVGINSINIEGKTPLLMALEHQDINVDFVKFLIDEGADIHFRNQVKSQHALREEENANKLESRKNLDENAIKIFGLLDDLKNNLSKCTSFLYEPININILKSAIESKNLIKIEFVLNYEINVIYKNQVGLGALYDFCSIFKTNRSEKMLKCLSLLLTKGCRDFNHNGFGETAIKFLANNGHLEAVKMLVEFGDSLEALNWSVNHKSVVFSDLQKLKSSLDLFSNSTVDQYERSPLILFIHFRNANDIKEIFNYLNMNDINLNDIKKGIELLIRADKCNELKEVLKYFPLDKVECHRLLMLSRKYKSPVSLDFLLDMNSSLTNEKILNEKELIEEIKKAFKEVKLNGGMGLKCAEAYDAYEYDKIDDMLEEEDDWQNISFEELEERRGGIRYFDSKGLLFHLPAYMICDLCGKLGSDLIENFTSEKYFELTKKFLNFNYDQMKVITNCFSFFQERANFESLQLKIGLDSIDKEKSKIISLYDEMFNTENDKITVLITNLNKILNTKLPLSQKKFTGIWNVWYENGVKQYESEYKDGKQNGKETSWYTNGAIESEHEYKDGVTNGKSRSWYSSGALKSEGEFNNGRRVNIYTLWYEGGAKQWEDVFNDKDGKPNGKTTAWYKNGNIEKEIGYFRDQPHGKYLKCDENGKILIDQDYKDGVMIKDNLASSK